MKQLSFSTILGYSAAAVMFTFGVVVLSGFLIPERVPSQLRITFGVVLVLMGIYRFVLTRTNVAQSSTEDE